MKAKLFGFVNPRQAIIKYPESDQTVPAHYARAYAYHLGAYPDKALSEAEALLKTDPHDPYFLELKGQILLESGRPAEAIAPLREATERSGRAAAHRIDARPRADLDRGQEEFRRGQDHPEDCRSAATMRIPSPGTSWGSIYDREGDTPRAALATAERNNLEGNPKLALASAEMAHARASRRHVRTIFARRTSPWCRGPS